MPQVSAAVAHIRLAPRMPNQSSFASALFFVYYDQLTRETRYSHDMDRLRYYAPKRPSKLSRLLLAQLHLTDTGGAPVCRKLEIAQTDRRRL